MGGTTTLHFKPAGRGGTKTVSKSYNLGSLKSVKMTAGSRDGWYFDHVHVKVGNGGWQRLYPDGQWLDGKAYDPKSGYAGKKYSNVIHMTLNKPAPPAPAHFRGCYQDNGSRDFKHGPKRYGYSSTSCMNACKSYKFVALQNNGWCSCDNGYSSPSRTYPKKPSGECNKGGTGKGGPWRNAVYTNVKYTKPVTVVQFRAKTGTVANAQSGANEKIEIRGSKGTTTLHFKPAGRGGTKTVSKSYNLGSLKSVKMTAGSRDGWCFDHVHVKVGNGGWQR